MFFQKKLSKSDRTIIEEYSDPKFKQKAIVLSKDFMRTMGFEFLDFPKRFELPLDIKFFAPGCDSPLRYDNAALCRHSNDWRIHKCVIRTKHYGDDRFSQLKVGDYFALRLMSDGEKAEGIGLFVSEACEADRALFNDLRNNGDNAVLVQSKLVELSRARGENPTLSKLTLNEVPLSESNCENGGDIYQCGLIAAKGRGKCTGEELEKKIAEANLNGAEGEELFDLWLSGRPLLGGKRVSSHVWVAKENAISPYDFSVQYEDGARNFIEVKTTTSHFERKFYVSIGELCAMGASNLEEVLLARIYNLKSSPRFRVARSTKKFAERVLGSLAMVEGVSVVNLSVSPDCMDFHEEEVTLRSQNSLL